MNAGRGGTARETDPQGPWPHVPGVTAGWKKALLGISRKEGAAGSVAWMEGRT